MTGESQFDERREEQESENLCKRSLEPEVDVFAEVRDSRYHERDDDQEQRVPHDSPPHNQPRLADVPPDHVPGRPPAPSRAASQSTSFPIWAGSPPKHRPSL